MISKAAVCIAVYNEEKNIISLFSSLIAQTRLPDEIIIVDDGSTDCTFLLLSDEVKKYRGPIKIQTILQANRGPAIARNRAWRSSSSEVCIFTDGDCIPERHWIERILNSFEASDRTLAVGGMYSPPASRNILSRFIGFEILWRYQETGPIVNCHGTYSLAVLRHVLLKLNGFNEQYPKPSGEDFDLTYRISEMGEIRLVRDAVVSHEHPKELWSYLLNQFRRGFDRVRLYLDHPMRVKKDSYTDSLIKYEVLATGASIYIFFFSLFFDGLWRVELFLFAFIFLSSFRATHFFRIEGGINLALYGGIVRMIRLFFWALGMHWGAICQFQNVLGKRVKGQL